jgi:hypothetical protein
VRVFSAIVMCLAALSVLGFGVVVLRRGRSFVSVPAGIAAVPSGTAPETRPPAVVSLTAGLRALSDSMSQLEATLSQLNEDAGVDPPPAMDAAHPPLRKLRREADELRGALHAILGIDVFAVERKPQQEFADVIANWEQRDSRPASPLVLFDTSAFPAVKLASEGKMTAKVPYYRRSVFGTAHVLDKIDKVVSKPARLFPSDMRITVVDTSAADADEVVSTHWHRTTLT